MTKTIEKVQANQIIAGPNDRNKLDAAALRDLAYTIESDGLAQPITVRPVMACACGRVFFYDPAIIGSAPLTCECSGELADCFEIVAGERRFRAVTQILELGEIDAIVRVMTDEQAAAIMLSENMGRKDLDPVDEALAYNARMVRFDWTVDEIATRAGVSKIRVQFRLKLLALRDELLGLVRSGDLSLGYAQIIASGGLDANRQMIATTRLRDNRSPTPAWLRREVNTLSQEQAQDSLFELAMWTIEAAASDNDQPDDPPTPTTAAAPVEGDTAAEIIRGQINFWRNAMDEWHKLGKSFKRNECRAAIASLSHLLEALPK